MYFCKFNIYDGYDRFLVGNSAMKAIELLIQKGVPESQIIFLNLISVS
jgi:uracil phosphoribosyltransferase